MKKLVNLICMGTRIRHKSMILVYICTGTQTYSQLFALSSFACSRLRLTQSPRGHMINFDIYIYLHFQSYPLMNL